MKLHRVAIGLFLALVSPAARAADYPVAKGYVSDFAGMLPPADRQALETRLRDYEHATSNEIAVAIVPSLQGQAIDEYARGLFAAWGVGKRRLNNGVLFLWAPTERKVRIQTGYGVQETLTDPETADILRQVTPFFRREEYTKGVNTAVDGIIARLGSAPAQAQEPAGQPPSQPETPPPSPERPHREIGYIVIGLLAVAGAAFAMKHHHDQSVKMERETPQTLARMARLLDEASDDRKAASTNMAALREKAPREVWEDFEAPLAAAPASLAAVGGELRALQARPREEYRQLRDITRELKHWQDRLTRITAVFGNIRDTLQYVGESRTQAAELLDSLPGSLANFEGRVAAADSDDAEKLLQAAQDTYAKAKAAAAGNPANWLKVHDLLMDVQACLERLEIVLNPGARTTRLAAFDRRWPGSEDDSDAAAVFLMMQPVWEGPSSSSSSTSSSGFDLGGLFGGSDSGGGDSGGFGGGDSGGGGSSDSY